MPPRSGNKWLEPRTILSEIIVFLLLSLITGLYFIWQDVVILKEHDKTEEILQKVDRMEQKLDRIEWWLDNFREQNYGPNNPVR